MSIAKSDCYDANQPLELSMVDTSVEWDDKGYRIDTDYFDFELSTNLIEDESADTVPQWEGMKESQAVTTSSNTGREISKRDPLRDANALKHAGFKCEFDNREENVRMRWQRSVMAM